MASLAQPTPTDDRVRTLPRWLDLGLAAVALVMLAPLLAGIALVVRVVDGGPVLFRQRRVGRHGVPFLMHKFRTLEPGGVPADEVTPAGDPRVTRSGRGLRRLRLDELPQLYDVLRGSMSLVGPRPETPADLAAIRPDLLARWLAVRPGLTGATQLAFFGEDAVLGRVVNPTAAYRGVLVPAKILHGLGHRGSRTALADLGVLLRTPFVVLSRRAHERSRRRVEALLRPGEAEPRDRADDARPA